MRGGEENMLLVSSKFILFATNVYLHSLVLDYYIISEIYSKKNLSNKNGLSQTRSIPFSTLMDIFPSNLKYKIK